MYFLHKMWSVINRYRRVLRACALQPDIDILPDKDRTELGDKVRLFTHLLHSSNAVAHYFRNCDVNYLHHESENVFVNK